MTRRGGGEWNIFFPTLCPRNFHVRRIATWRWLDWTHTPRSNSQHLVLRGSSKGNQGKPSYLSMLNWLNPTCVKTIKFSTERTLKINPSFSKPRRKVVQHVKGTYIWIFLELQGNEGSVPLGVYLPHLYQKRLKTNLTTVKENESISKGYTQRRTAKVVGFKI